MQGAFVVDEVGHIGAQADDAAVRRAALAEADPLVTKHLVQRHRVAFAVLGQPVLYPLFLAPHGFGDGASPCAVANKVFVTCARHHQVGRHRVQLAVTVVAQHQFVLGVKQGNRVGQDVQRHMQLDLRLLCMAFGGCGPVVGVRQLADEQPLQQRSQHQHQHCHPNGHVVL